MNVEDDAIQVTSTMSDERYEKLLSYKERRQDRLLATVAWLGTLGIIAATIVTLVWSPWN